MYQLDVSKHSTGFEIRAHTKGCSIEDCMYVSAEDANRLVREGRSISRGNPSTSSQTPKKASFVNLGSGTIQFVFEVVPNYIKVFVLTRVELKLFVASLKRAIDG